MAPPQNVAYENASNFFATQCESWHAGVYHGFTLASQINCIDKEGGNERPKIPGMVKFVFFCPLGEILFGKACLKFTFVYHIWP